MRNGRFIWIVACLVAGMALAGCGVKNLGSQAGTDASAEPDKVLYERAMDDIQHGRYDVGRLSLETLINSYPDSEYMAKAKLAIADAYFKEGGTSGMTQAVAQYQDFIVFFPDLDETAYAQMQIGMAHYKRMEKADQDTGEALDAEAAFQAYLQKYPNDKNYKAVEQYLRNIQEVLAEGNFRVASFYYIRGIAGYRAATARLAELTNRYPLYSKADQANWMLASIYQRTEHNDLAAQIYTRIVKDYPLSPLVADAKTQLVKLGDPVPQPDPTALARMQKEQNTPRPRQSLFVRSTSMFRTTPNVNMAAQEGEPNLSPEDQQNNEAFTPGNLRIGPAIQANSTASTPGTGAFVETVAPGSSSSIAPDADPSSSASSASPSSASAAPTSGSSSPSDPPPGTGVAASGDPANQPANATVSNSAGANSTSANSTSGGDASANSSGSGDQSQQSSSSNQQNQGESSSKKKKKKIPLL